MLKRKQVFEEFEQAFAFDYFFGSEVGGEETQKGYQGLPSPQRNPRYEEVKH
jgi:hypothetical protein